jgi:hypothetical protein
MSFPEITDKDIDDLKCARLKVRTHELRAKSVCVAECIDGMYGTVRKFEYPRDYKSADHWLAWAESRLFVLRAPVPKSHMWGDIIGYAVVPLYNDEDFKMCIFCQDKNTADKIYKKAVEMILNKVKYA